MEEMLTGADLAKYERETSVLWNELEKEVIIYTSSRKVITKCKNAGYEIIFEDDNGVQFRCLKKCISFRNAVSKPRKPMSEEHKKVLFENRGKKQVNK